MSWAFTHAIRGDLSAQLAADQRNGALACATGVRRAAGAGKRGIRAQLVASRLGKLQGLVRSRVTPLRGGSFDAHGEVFAIPLSKERQVDPLTVFDEGAIVTVHGTQFLAIWEPAAGRRGVRRATWQELRTLLKPKRTASGWVLVFRNDPRRIAFTLVPLARVRKHLDLDAIAAKAANTADTIAADWERRDARSGIVI